MLLVRRAFPVGPLFSALRNWFDDRKNLVVIFYGILDSCDSKWSIILVITFQPLTPLPSLGYSVFEQLGLTIVLDATTSAAMDCNDVDDNSVAGSVFMRVSVDAVILLWLAAFSRVQQLPGKQSRSNPFWTAVNFLENSNWAAQEIKIRIN